MPDVFVFKFLVENQFAICQIIYALGSVYVSAELLWLLNVSVIRSEIF